MLKHIALMILVPLAVVALSAAAGGAVAFLFPMIDRRYISLVFGVPWTLAAGVVAVRCSSNGFRLVGIVGFLFWLGAGLLAMWSAIAFWNG